MSAATGFSAAWNSGWGVADVHALARLFACLVIAVLSPPGAAAPAARAGAEGDSILVRGGTIPLRDVEVTDIASGQVFYTVAGARRAWRRVEELEAIRFDGEPALAEAETLIAQGDVQAGEARLRDVLRVTRRDLVRVWVRLRLHGLARAQQDGAGEVEHLAALIALREDAWWRTLEPRPRPGAGATATAIERARRTLGDARERARAPDVLRLLDRLRALLDALDVVPDAPAAPSPGPGAGGQPRAAERPVASGTPRPSAPDSSGRAPAPAAVGDRAARDATTGRRDAPATATGRAPVLPPAEQRPDEAGTPDAPPPRGPATQETIDDLLRAGRFTEAIAACEAAVRAPGARDAPRLLRQFAEALEGAGDRVRAVLMRLRVAVALESAAAAAGADGAHTQAADAYARAAVLYGETFDDRAGAARLLRRALELAGDGSAAERIRPILAQYADHP
ncbi:MAG: hypothetical protein KF817_05765 [Phycisphaeraceae bacterium]|nr:hypothetical protein [Phycisphaeraceae bacterium]